MNRLMLARDRDARFSLARYDSTMAAAMRFPADPALRRQLWKQWTHLDVPSVERKVAPRRVKPVSVSTPADEWARATIDATPGVVDGLRSAIAAAVVNGQISLSDRQRLIARATRLGLNRFEASLLVAAVQHREAEAAGIQVIREWKRPRQTRSVGTIVAACVALELVAGIGIAFWLRA